jgi:hypothetical protein
MSDKCHVTDRDVSHDRHPLSIEGCHVTLSPPPVSPRTSRAVQSSTTPGPSPRLLNLRQAAVVLGVSFWSVRDYVLAGLLPSVQLPALRPREGDRPKQSLRRVLVDVEDLDAFITRHKAIQSGDVQSREPAISRTNSRALSPVCARTEGAPKREIGE